MEHIAEEIMKDQTLCLEVLGFLDVNFIGFHS